MWYYRTFLPPNGAIPGNNMRDYLSKNHRLRISIALFAFGLVALALFPPKTLWGDWLYNHRPWLAWIYLFLGVFFLLFDQIRLVFICMACSALISLHAYELEYMQYERQLRRSRITHDSLMPTPSFIPQNVFPESPNR